MLLATNMVIGVTGGLPFGQPEARPKAYLFEARRGARHPLCSAPRPPRTPPGQGVRGSRMRLARLRPFGLISPKGENKICSAETIRAFLFYLN